MRRYIKAVGAGQKRARDLGRDEAREAMRKLLDEAEPIQVGAFLLALRMKGEGADELAGFVSLLDERCARAVVPEGTIAVDAHGDGHAGVVSLLPAAACAAAALGVPVWIDVEARSPFAQHGLDGGLHAIGVFSDTMDPRAAAHGMAVRGVAACDLGRACPPLARLVGHRSLLGVRTVAQTLAKLVSPARAHRLVGAFHAPYVEPLARALGLILEGKRGLVTQALGGLPEARPGKILRVADAGGDGARVIDFTRLASAALPVPSEDADVNEVAHLANAAALSGKSPFAEHAATTAALLVHAATAADPIDAARRALAALGDGRARAIAERVA